MASMIARNLHCDLSSEIRYNLSDVEFSAAWPSLSSGPPHNYEMTVYIDV